jgi:uncharacterized protein
MHNIVFLFLFISCSVYAKEGRVMLTASVGHEFKSKEIPSVAPSQRLHLILLGVESVAKSTKFYESIGWKKSPTSNEGFVKFDLGGYALCLISRSAFAKDAMSTTSQSMGFSGIGLIYLAKTVEEVPKILAKAVEAGGTLVKPATRTHWGVAGYFKDPDGHLFEVDYENAWTFDGEHRLIVDEVN